MKLFSWLTGGAESAEKLFDGVVNGVDALVLTDEERVQYNAEAQKLWLEHQKSVANESTPRSVNRRVVAWSVIVMTSLITISATVLAVMGFNDEAKTVIAIAESFKWGWAFVAVIIFYFGNHIVSKLKS